VTTKDDALLAIFILHCLPRSTAEMPCQACSWAGCWYNSYVSSRDAPGDESSGPRCREPLRMEVYRYDKPTHSGGRNVHRK
jgi:hypothetical protein